MALRRIQLELRSMARCDTRSTLRPTMPASSSSIATWSSRLQSASGAKLTSKSKSLSGRKSSRSADPNTRSSAIFHRRQNSSSCCVGMGISARIGPLLTSLPQPNLTGGLGHRVMAFGNGGTAPLKAGSRANQGRQVGGRRRPPERLSRALARHRHEHEALCEHGPLATWRLLHLASLFFDGHYTCIDFLFGRTDRDLYDPRFETRMLEPQF